MSFYIRGCFINCLLHALRPWCPRCACGKSTFLIGAAFFKGALGPTVCKVSGGFAQFRICVFCLYLWICISVFVYWHFCICVSNCVYSLGRLHTVSSKNWLPPSPVVPYRQPTRSCGQCTRPHKHIRPEKRSKLKLGMLEGISISQFRVIRPPIHSLIHLGRTNFKSMWWKLFVDMTCHMASKASVPSTHADAVEHFHPRFTFSLIRWSLRIDKTLRIRVVFVDMTWQSHGHPPQSTHTCGEPLGQLDKSLSASHSHFVLTTNIANSLKGSSVLLRINFN